MGFDWVHCYAPLPDEKVIYWPEGSGYQTKCMDGNAALYVITIDGRLLLADEYYGWSKDCVDTRPLPRYIDYTGHLTFYTGSRQVYQDDVYQAEFVNGNMKELVKLPRPKTAEQIAQEEKEQAEWDALTPEEQTNRRAKSLKEVGESLAMLLQMEMDRPSFMGLLLHPERYPKKPKFYWVVGRHKTGYDKMCLRQKKWPIPHDIYLIRYREGSCITPHRDTVTEGRHHRLNIVLWNSAEGGKFVCEKPIFSFWRFHLFRSDLSTHSVTEITKGTRYVLSIGWVTHKGKSR